MTTRVARRRTSKTRPSQGGKFHRPVGEQPALAVEARGAGVDLRPHGCCGYLVCECALQQKGITPYKTHTPLLDDLIEKQKKKSSKKRLREKVKRLEEQRAQMNLERAEERRRMAVTLMQDTISAHSLWRRREVPSNCLSSLRVPALCLKELSKTDIVTMIFDRGMCCTGSKGSKAGMTMQVKGLAVHDEEPRGDDEEVPVPF